MRSTQSPTLSNEECSSKRSDGESSKKRTTLVTPLHGEHDGRASGRLTGGFTIRRQRWETVRSRISETRHRTFNVRLAEGKDPLDELSPQNSKPGALAGKKTWLSTNNDDSSKLLTRAPPSSKTIAPPLLQRPTEQEQLKRTVVFTGEGKGGRGRCRPTK